MPRTSVRNSSESIERSGFLRPAAAKITERFKPGEGGFLNDGLRKPVHRISVYRLKLSFQPPQKGYNVAQNGILI